MHNLKLVVLLGILLLFGCSSTPTGKPVLQTKDGFDMRVVAQGRSLVLANGCNDCHTRGYLLNPEQTPTIDWLTGSDAGLNGPWGTLYPANLRLLLDSMSQDQWLNMAKHVKATPMMPWSTLRQMKPDQLAAIYQFVRYLGPKGRPAPAAQPPR